VTRSSRHDFRSSQNPSSHRYFSTRDGTFLRAILCHDRTPFATGKCHFVFSYIVDYKHIWQMQKLMKMMKGGNQKKMMRQMEQMKGRGGIPGF
jgi:hypothetical protein